MGLLEVLQVVFVVLKLAGVVAWSWWTVLWPAYVIAAWIAWIVAIDMIAESRWRKQQMDRTLREIEEMVNPS